MCRYIHKAALLQSALCLSLPKVPTMGVVRQLVKAQYPLSWYCKFVLPTKGQKKALWPLNPTLRAFGARDIEHPNSDVYVAPSLAESEGPATHSHALCSRIIYDAGEKHAQKKPSKMATLHTSGWSFGT